MKQIRRTVLKVTGKRMKTISLAGAMLLVAATEALARRGYVKSKSLSLASAVLAATGVLVAAHTAVGADWPSAGADLNNSRYQSNETRISAETVGSLQLKWTVDTNGDVTAHPTVDGNNL